MTVKTVQFLAIVLLAIALVPAGAHLFALPNKVGLDRENYFAVQQIYRGWALFGIPLLSALVVTFALALLSRPQGMPFLFAAASFVLLLATLVTFFIWVYPANQATDNWTRPPGDWERLRAQWEYVHAVNAVITFAALVSAIVSALTWTSD